MTLQDLVKAIKKKRDYCDLQYKSYERRLLTKSSPLVRLEAAEYRAVREFCKELLKKDI
jgi:hypothetical protein